MVHNESDLLEDNSTSIFSSQTSPRPLQIDSDCLTSTQEENGQQEAPSEDVTPTFEQLSQPLLAHEETIVAESTMEDVEEEVIREVRSLISDPLLKVGRITSGEWYITRTSQNGAAMV